MEPSNAELSMPTDSGAASALNMANASQTEIRVEHVTHSWTVKNFSHCYQEYLENFVNLHRGDETLTWSIKIYPKGNGENNKDFVFLCLNRVVNSACKAGKIGFKSRFVLKTCEMKEIEMRIHPNPSHSDYVSYIKRDVLFPQILPKDSIIVFVEIDVAVETVTTSADEANSSSLSASAEQQLMDDYLKMWKDNVLTDFTIRVGERELRAHRAILAARSPVFAAMFEHPDTHEVKNGLLVIEDLDYDVVSEMLSYIYSGRCSREINDLAMELLVAADKYRLEELKAHCERHLIQSLAFDNACQLLILSDMHSAERLRARVVQFIVHHPRNITHTTGWEDIVRQHPSLVTDIVRNFDKQ